MSLPIFTFTTFMIFNLCLGCDTRSAIDNNHSDLEFPIANDDMAPLMVTVETDGMLQNMDDGVERESDAQVAMISLDRGIDEPTDMNATNMFTVDMERHEELDHGVMHDLDLADMLISTDMTVSNIDAGDMDMMTLTGPQVCTMDNAGQCECSHQTGFTTYTWQVEGQQRCFTVYTPTSDEPLPAIIHMNCYARNNLRAGGCRSDSALIAAANTFGFVAICASSTDGDWTFGNDGVSNDNNPTPCAAEDSKDIGYLNGLLGIIDLLGTQQVVDSSRIYTSGFSQNSMFAAYAAICFPDQISGVWQGGSGLFVAGETNPLPQMEGVCRRSDFQEHGESCVDLTPCEACQYFPAYPVTTTTPRRACVMAYEDDYLFPTARPMYNRLILEGHDATLLSFPNIGRGHSAPLQEWEWVVHCLGISPACTTACSTAVVECMTEEMSEPNPPTDPGPHPCGDGRCDQVESNNPRLCPRDCEERPDDFDWCGDGLCDALENHRSSCPIDCGQSPNQSNLEALIDRFDRCLSETTECEAGCSATREMLNTVERPIIDEPMP